MAERSPIDERIAAARARLASNLGALQDRLTRVRKLVSPATYLDNAWVNLGLGIAIGYVVGRRPRGRRKQLASGSPPPAARSGSIADEVIKSVVRAAASGLAGALIRRALARETKRSD